MFYLNDILGHGYQAHVMLFRSRNQGLDATAALTQRDGDGAGNPAVLIGDLLRGDISAQARAIYNSQMALSLIQTLDYGARVVASHLQAAADRIDEVATGVYSTIEVAERQLAVEQSLRAVGRTTEEVRYREQALLQRSEPSLQVSVDNGLIMEVPTADLRWSFGPLDLAGDPAEARGRIRAAQDRVTVYRHALAERSRDLRHQVGLAETELARTMGYGINEPNDAAAETLARDVVASVLARSTVALSAQAHLSGPRAAWLFSQPLQSPHRLD